MISKIKTSPKFCPKFRHSAILLDLSPSTPDPEARAALRGALTIYPRPIFLKLFFMLLLCSGGNYFYRARERHCLAVTLQGTARLLHNYYLSV
jgi:hypothetical protein